MFAAALISPVDPDFAHRFTCFGQSPSWNSTLSGMFMLASLINARAASPYDSESTARAAFENSSIATAALTASAVGCFDSMGSLAATGVTLGTLRGSRRESANVSFGGGPCASFAFAFSRFFREASAAAGVSSSSSSSSAGTIGSSCSWESSPRPSSIRAESIPMTSAKKVSTSPSPTSAPAGAFFKSDRLMESRTISRSSDSVRGVSPRNRGARRFFAGSVAGDWSSSSQSSQTILSPGRMVGSLSVSFFTEPNF